MEFLSDEHVSEILESLNKEFDSHRFIFEYMRKFPQEYTYGLYEYRNSKDPIRAFHAVIGKQLLNHSKLTALGKDSTPNIRGLHSENEKWKKLD